MKAVCVVLFSPHPAPAEGETGFRRLADGCDPAAGCNAPDIRVLMCAFTVASRKRGPAPRSGAPSSFRFERERSRVDAIAQSGRLGAVFKQVPKMRVAAAAQHFGAKHQVAVVVFGPDTSACRR